jgi:hypothetical protein
MCLLNEMLSAPGLQLVLFPEGDITRPSSTCVPVGESPVSIPCNAQGRLDLSNLQAFAEENKKSNAAKWVKRLKNEPTGFNPTLYEFMIFAASDNSKSFKDLHKQMVWSVGQKLDDFLYQRDAKNASYNVQVKFSSLAESDIEMVRYNAMYTEGICNSVSSHTPLRMLSCAPDKSRVHGMGLMNTPFALEDNEAFWGHPQDRHMSPIGCPLYIAGRFLGPGGPWVAE